MLFDRTLFVYCRQKPGAARVDREYTICMLKLSQSLLNRPVMSLRTGQQVATTTRAIINPNNLKIEGLYCSSRFKRHETVLLYQDIRDIIPQGLVIDEQEVLAEPHDLVRLKETLQLSFELIGKQVVTVSKRKLGKVTDFATEVETMYIQKLYVSQGVLKSFTGGSLGIDRNQIYEITDKKIIVNDPLEQGTVHAGAIA